MIRGAFEFQGQKCSAASRAYVAQVGVEEDEGLVPRRGRGHLDGRRRPTSPTSWARSSTTGRSPSTRPRSRGPSAPTSLTSRRRPGRRLGRLLRPADRRRGRATRPTRCSRPSTSARSSPCTSTTTTGFEKVVRPDGVDRAVRPDRRDHRPGPSGHRLGAPRSCGSPPATSTSTTSRPARSSGSSRSAAAGPPAPTTRPAPRSTCCAGPARASIKETFVPPTDYRYPYMG